MGKPLSMLILHIFNATNDQDLSRIPQFVVYSDMPQTKRKFVACTQPRRLATMSAAKRVADEMDGVFCASDVFCFLISSQSSSESRSDIPFVSRT
jgi:HrpA-like RNA helicase